MRIPFVTHAATKAVAVMVYDTVAVSGRTKVYRALLRLNRKITPGSQRRHVDHAVKTVFRTPGTCGTFIRDANVQNLLREAVSRFGDRVPLLNPATGVGSLLLKRVLPQDEIAAVFTELQHMMDRNRQASRPAHLIAQGAGKVATGAGNVFSQFTERLQRSPGELR